MSSPAPQQTVSLEAVLREYQAMHADQTLAIAQLRAALADRTRELQAEREKNAAADEAPAAWPYEHTDPAGTER
ncbi:hypothetical protein ACGFZP_13310 [Kitasatospora sp. NPDC048239]|uniref:hypothetical protein n=1 Tax=Kitasatospora sp. NPDC048239 TaxID=3364046 RepID=UPI003714DC29